MCTHSFISPTNSHSNSYNFPSFCNLSESASEGLPEPPHHERGKSSDPLRSGETYFDPTLVVAVVQTPRSRRLCVRVFFSYNFADFKLVQTCHNLCPINGVTSVISQSSFPSSSIGLNAGFHGFKIADRSRPVQICLAFVVRVK